MPRTHIVSYSELDTYRQCAYKHELAYKERWTSATTSPALSRGTLWHAVMEHHYKAIQAHDLTETPKPDIEAHYLTLVKTHLSDETDETELIAWMLKGYLEHYGYDEQWEILAVEHAPTVWLPTPNGGRSNFKLKLKIDLIVKQRNTDRIWVIDHKSGRSLPKQKQLDINDQFGLYTWALQAMGKRVFGQMHNAARTERLKSREMTPDERYSRTLMHRTDDELKSIAIDAYKTARQAYKTPLGEAGRSPDDDRCGWRCNYTDACLYGRKRGDNTETRVFLRDSGYIQDFTRH